MDGSSSLNDAVKKVGGQMLFEPVELTGADEVHPPAQTGLVLKRAFGRVMALTLHPSLVGCRTCQDGFGGSPRWKVP